MKKYNRLEMSKTKITFDEACQSLFGFKIEYSSYWILNPKEIITVI